MARPDNAGMCGLNGPGQAHRRAGSSFKRKLVAPGVPMLPIDSPRVLPRTEAWAVEIVDALANQPIPFAGGAT